MSADTLGSWQLSQHQRHHNIARRLAEHAPAAFHGAYVVFKLNLFSFSAAIRISRIILGNHWFLRELSQYGQSREARQKMEEMAGRQQTAIIAGLVGLIESYKGMVPKDLAWVDIFRPLTLRLLAIDLEQQEDIYESLVLGSSEEFRAHVEDSIRSLDGGT